VLLVNATISRGLVSLARGIFEEDAAFWHLSAVLAPVCKLLAFFIGPLMCANAHHGRFSVASSGRRQHQESTFLFFPMQG
jgi:hypothetical protein